MPARMLSEAFGPGLSVPARRAGRLQVLPSAPERGGGALQDRAPTGVHPKLSPSAGGGPRPRRSYRCGKRAETPLLGRRRASLQVRAGIWNGTGAPFLV